MQDTCVEALLSEHSLYIKLLPWYRIMTLSLKSLMGFIRVSCTDQSMCVFSVDGTFFEREREIYVLTFILS